MKNSRSDLIIWFKYNKKIILIIFLFIFMLYGFRNPDKVGFKVGNWLYQITTSFDKGYNNK